MADVPFGLGDVKAAFPRIDPSLLTGISNHMAELSRPTIPDIPANAFTQNLDIGPYISKRSWHQLVIIGNGFDLECGLPSSFSSFVSDRKKRLRAEGHSRESCQPDCVATMTTWDVILENADDYGWCDIEGAISNWIVPKKDSNGRVALNRPFEVLACLKGQKTAHSINMKNVPEKTVAAYIRERVGDDADTWEVPELLGFLRSELSVLEHDFDAYLSHSVKASKSYKDRAQELVFTLLSEERPDVDDYDIEESVLSFNYTRIANRLRTNDHDIHYVNIHGKLGGEIIFGIDGTGLLSDVDISPFTKTYRLMNLDLPDTASLVWDASDSYNDDGTALIKFYGHSLGEADYSYFQAIFDTVRLYEGNTRLIFYFRPHAGLDEAKARREMMEKAIKLLSAYGETLDNKDHGKNLIHKLLIEGRLSVSLLPPGKIKRR